MERSKYKGKRDGVDKKGELNTNSLNRRQFFLDLDIQHTSNSNIEISDNKCSKPYFFS